MLNILMVHNRYQQKGGEDVSTRNEVQLLRNAGHHVNLIEYDNHQINQIGKVNTAIRTLWSSKAANEISSHLDKKSYDILHVQNFFPLVSPAVMWAAKKKGVATVQALRNYRLLCTNAQLFREGKDCEKCLNLFAPLYGIYYGCYRQSRLGSAILASMVALHKSIGTWKSKTDAFISVSEYVKQQYIRGGFQEDKVHAKPNVVAAAPFSLNGVCKKAQICYIGRLAVEKGVDILIKAWLLENRKGKLVIAGSGPYEAELRMMAGENKSIEFLGHVSSLEASRIMAKSLALVIPSLWAEPFPRTGIESFSVGTPVIGAASGGITELIENTGAGILYSSNDIEMLSKYITRLFLDDTWREGISGKASNAFMHIYSPEAILKRTEEIYALALKTSHSQHRNI